VKKRGLGVFPQRAEKISFPMEKTLELIISCKYFRAMLAGFTTLSAQRGRLKI
jgi:hypothetical protein